MKTVWNYRLFASFIVSFAATLPALTQTVQWTPFSSKELEFSALFCGAPSADPPTVEKKDAITGTTWLFKASGKNYFCLVGVSQYDLEPNVEKELLLNQTNFIKAVNGTLVASRRTEFVNAPKKLPALTFAFAMPPNYLGKSIVVLKGSRVYETAFVYRKNMDYTAALEKFLSSLEITANKVSGGSSQVEATPPPSRPTISATGNAAALAEQCKKKGDTGDYADAAEICKEAVGSNPRDTESWSNLGTALFEAKRHAEAVQAFLHVVRLNPNDAHAQYGVGAGYVETKEYDKAVPYLRQAVRLDAKNANEWYDLGHSLYEIKQYANAEQALEEADRLQPDDDSTEYWLGRTYVRMGRKVEALAAYQKLAGTNADAGKKMAQQLYAEINKMDAAPR